MLKRFSAVFWLPVIWACYIWELLPLLLTGIILAGVYEVYSQAKDSGLWVVIGVLHIGGLGLMFWMSKEALWFLIVLTIATDAAALFGGTFFNFSTWLKSGFSKISPNKTRGGVLYGIIAGSIAGAIVVTHFELPILLIFLAPFFCGAAVLGDLLGSGFKRQLQIKDSGQGLITATLLYGHGGVVDRFDALAFLCYVWAVAQFSIFA